MMGSSEVDNKCRLCLSNDVLKESILIPMNDSIPVSYKIMVCLGVMVSPDDRHSKFLCGNCANLLDLFFQFRKISFETYLSLNEVSNNNSKDIEEGDLPEDIFEKSDFDESCSKTQTTPVPLDMESNVSEDSIGPDLDVTHSDESITIKDEFHCVTLNDEAGKESTLKSEFHCLTCNTVFPDVHLLNKHTNSCLRTTNEEGSINLIQIETTESKRTAESGNEVQPRAQRQCRQTLNSSHYIAVDEGGSKNLKGDSDSQVESPPNKAESKRTAESGNEVQPRPQRKCRQTLNSSHYIDVDEGGSDSDVESLPNTAESKGTAKKGHKKSRRPQRKCSQNLNSSHYLDVDEEGSKIIKGNSDYPIQTDSEDEYQPPKIDPPERKKRYNCKGEYKCALCDENFDRYLLLKKHLRVKHRGERAFRCQVCSMSFSDMYEFKYHQRVHEDTQDFSCKHCGRRFYKLSCLRDHERSHTGEKPYSCSVCKKTFINIRNLNHHSKIHSSERRFSCKFCPKTFKHLLSLQGHEILHRGGLFNHQCNTCHHMFKTEQLLQIHSLYHSKAGKHLCAYCNKTFKSARDLRAHSSQKHSGQNPMACSICFETFRTSELLKKHRLTHKESYPFPCPHCPQSFSKKQTLRGHLRSKHANQSVSLESNNTLSTKDIDETTTGHDSIHNNCLTAGHESKPS